MKGTKTCPDTASCHLERKTGPGEEPGAYKRLKTRTMVVSVSTKLRTLFPLTATREELWSVRKTTVKRQLRKGCYLASDSRLHCFHYYREA